MSLLIGQDTELFLRRGDNFTSAYGVIPGSKTNPYPVKKGAVQVDGMALEFNTLPAKTYRQFNININTVLSRLQEMIPEDCDMVITPVANFDEEYMKVQPQESRELGCDPDYNAYTGEQNPPPIPHPTMRTAAGHIHIGWTENADPHSPGHLSDCISLTKQCDYLLGVPALFLEENNERRQMYGKAGAFRPKPYGLEYRVLSNFWISSNEYMEFIYNYTKKAYDHLNRGLNYHEHLKNKYEGKISAQRAINFNDIRMAKKILDECSIRLPR